MELLGASLTGFIFEQEYLRQQDRPPVTEMAAALDAFFRDIPRDSRYHLELRTDLYLREPIFEVLERHGVEQASPTGPGCASFAKATDQSWREVLQWRRPNRHQASHALRHAL